MCRLWHFPETLSLTHVKRAFLALTRQIIFLLPLVVALPLYMGIDGIMYAGPVADFLAAAVAGIMVMRELKRKEYRLGNHAPEGAE